MLIHYEKESGSGLVFLQWSAAEGQPFSAHLAENGRRPVLSPAFGRYPAKAWLALNGAELERIKAEGPDARDGRTVELQEILPGKAKGETFTASFGSFIADKSTAVSFNLDGDPIVARMQAGNLLNDKAKAMAKAEGIPYATAFVQVCKENQDLYNAYRNM